jgi:hypothetical protein
MGSFKRSHLSNDQIIARYRDGESVALVALRCRMPRSFVEGVLVAANVRLRGRGEALRLAVKGSGRFASTRRMWARRQ